MWDTISIPFVEGYCSINDVLKDSNGNFWITTNDYCLTGCYKFDGNTWIDYNTSDILSSAVGNSLYGIIENSKGEIFISLGTRIIKFKDEKWSVFLDMAEKADNTCMTYGFIEASNGMFLMGFYNLYSWNGKSFRLIDLTEYEKDNDDYRFITCFYEDRNGNVWVGTSDGLFRVDFE